ncbi:potassium transporter KefB [Emticicia sp. BO119]|uniref:potassium transporter KefB n=1 Tax=Emticicia sp. BO119 TaxID=2757768 RepID=UPI0015F109C5|nr:potassium transporter KefB [Emticicia sp. BO119]MBA4849586.1 potassium transporter KefB [Emticicia sp. BO119]
MTAKNNLTAQGSQTNLLVKRVLLGAALGLAIILFFVLITKNPKPEWGKYWMIRPLIITPLAGAMAGVCNHLLDALRNQGGSKKLIASILMIVIYLIGLWLGTVLGLDGTLWD